MIDQRIAATLDRCRKSAQRCERAADALGAAWTGWKPLMDAASRFRQRCDERVDGRQFDMATVAFVGPKKAGKSTLIRLLLTDESARQQLKAGSSLTLSTERLIWIGPRQPVGMDPAVEEYVPCASTSLPALGFACTFADVPGDDEDSPARAHAAQRALELALIKVLVIPFRDRSNRATLELLGRAGASLILPVITKIRPDDDRMELSGFAGKLQQRFPEATILEPLLSEDFLHRDTPEDYESQLTATLAAKVGSALARQPVAALLSDLLDNERRRFLEEVGAITKQHLFSSAQAARELVETRDGVLGSLATGLLGQDRELRAGLRWALGTSLVEQTPAWCFPWRPVLSVAVLGAGALDRLPLALVGSIPSLGVVIYQAVKNIRAGSNIAQTADEGLSQRLREEMRHALHDRFVALDDALTQEAGIIAAEAATEARASFEIIGLAELQRRSSALFQRTVDRHKPSGRAATVAAFMGFVIFWLCFGWPLAALYEDLAAGARAVWERHPDARSLFPQDAGSLLFTTAFLAVLPMFLFLVAIFSWFLRLGRINSALKELRDGHQAICDELIEAHAVRVKVSEPRLDACLKLVTLEFEET